MPAPLVAPAAPSCPRGGPYPPGAGAGAHSTPPGRAPRRPARPEEPSTLWGAAARSPGPLPTPRRLCGSARAPTRVPAAPAPATLSRGPHAPPPCTARLPKPRPGTPARGQGPSVGRWRGGPAASKPPCSLGAAGAEAVRGQAGPCLCQADSASRDPTEPRENRGRQAGPRASGAGAASQHKHSCSYNKGIYLIYENNVQ